MSAPARLGKMIIFSIKMAPQKDAFSAPPASYATMCWIIELETRPSKFQISVLAAATAAEILS